MDDRKFDHNEGFAPYCLAEEDYLGLFIPGSTTMVLIILSRSTLHFVLASKKNSSV